MGSNPVAPRARIPKEMPMKELNDREVLAIAGGLPPGAALDEVLYRAPAEPLRDPMAFAELAIEARPEAAKD